MRRHLCLYDRQVVYRRDQRAVRHRLQRGADCHSRGSVPPKLSGLRDSKVQCGRHRHQNQSKHLDEYQQHDWFDSQY